jgi:integrase/recombinase XerC
MVSSSASTGASTAVIMQWLNLHGPTSNAANLGRKVRRSWFGRTRTVAFGRRTAVPLDRYLRVRAKHKHGRSNDLWLAERTGPVSGAMTGDGIYQMVRRRGEEIGVPRLRPHIFRHAWARFARLEGRLHDVELQRLAGWKSRQMLARYSASAAGERALDAGKRSALGDRL